jgi:hypothetical protein
MEPGNVMSKVHLRFLGGDEELRYTPQNDFGSAILSADEHTFGCVSPRIAHLKQDKLRAVLANAIPEVNIVYCNVIWEKTMN